MPPELGGVCEQWKIPLTQGLEQGHVMCYSFPERNQWTPAPLSLEAKIPSVAHNLPSLDGLLGACLESSSSMQNTGHAL